MVKQRGGPGLFPPFRWWQLHANAPNLTCVQLVPAGGSGSLLVILAYNLSFLVYFFSRNSMFLSQQISQQCFSASLSERGPYL
jgi:hypothetical protein